MDACRLDVSNNNKFQKIWLCYVTSCMLVMPIAEIIAESIGRTFAWQAQILSIYGLLGLVLVFVDKKFNAKNDKMFLGDMFFYTLLAFMLISWIFSEDPACLTIAYRSNTEYSEWPDHFLAYYSLMYGASRIVEDKYRKLMVYVFALFGIIEVTLAILQTFGIWLAECMYTPEETNDFLISYGLTQNCNFYGGIVVLMIALFTGIFVLSEKVNYLAYLLLMATFYTLITCVSRLTWVGTCGIVFFFIVSFIVCKKKKGESAKGRSARLAAVLAGFLVVIILMMIFRPFYLNFTAEKISEQAEEISESKSLDRLGTGRGLIWKMGLKTVPSHLLTGVGQDNYGYAFTSDPNWHYGMYFQSKGHNEYIHTLVTQGVPALINYLALLVYACYLGVQIVLKEDKVRRYTTWIFLGMFAGYTAQALFNSSIINVAIYFWVVLGLVMPIDSQKEIKKIHPIEKMKSLEKKKDE